MSFIEKVSTLQETMHVSVYVAMISLQILNLTKPECLTAFTYAS